MASLSAKTYFLSYSTSRYETSASDDATQPASSHEAAISLAFKLLREASRLASKSLSTPRTLSARVPVLPEGAGAYSPSYS